MLDWQPWASETVVLIMDHRTGSNGADCQGSLVVCLTSDSEGTWRALVGSVSILGFLLRMLMKSQQSPVIFMTSVGALETEKAPTAPCLTSRPSWLPFIFFPLHLSLQGGVQSPNTVPVCAAHPRAAHCKYKQRKTLQYNKRQATSCGNGLSAFKYSLPMTYPC